MSYRVNFSSFSPQMIIGDMLTLLIHSCWLVHLNSNWAHFTSGHDGLSPAGLSDGEVTWEDSGATGTVRQRSCLLLLPGARCRQDTVWCDPFAWFGAYRVRIGDTVAPTHTAHRWLISHPTSINLSPSNHIHISYETTQEQKTPKATSRCT